MSLIPETKRSAIIRTIVCAAYVYYNVYEDFPQKPGEWVGVFLFFLIIWVISSAISWLLDLIRIIARWKK